MEGKVLPFNSVFSNLIILYIVLLHQTNGFFFGGGGGGQMQSGKYIKDFMLTGKKLIYNVYLGCFCPVICPQAPPPPLCIPQQQQQAASGQ
jgi:hypothetical protein